jgi:hypothetical protein
MKYAEDHPTFECEKEKTIPAKCANCNGEPRSINKNCPMRPKEERKHGNRWKKTNRQQSRKSNEKKEENQKQPRRKARKKKPHKKWQQ